MILRDGASPVLADPAHPATAGDTLAIQCTGLGLLSPSIRITATIGRQPADVIGVSALDGTPGVYQVVVTVPANVDPGDSVPLTLRADTVTSAPATIAVR